MADYISEGVEVCLATESQRGTAPSSDYVRLQVDVGGINDFERKYTDVERDIHSVYATDEDGDHVAYSVEPSLVHDINKDFMDAVVASVMRCNLKHFGGTGLSLFRPSAVVDGGGSNDSFTVASLGALPNGLLIKTRGFTETANNGLFLTAGTSTGTAIKVATGTLTAEASPPANATLDVVGFQGGSGDLAIDSAGDLTSSVLDFTTLGIVAGMDLYFPNPTQASVMGSAAYAFASTTGRATVKTVAANKLTLQYHTFAIAADAGTAKTVRVFCYSRFARNYAIDDTTNYNEVTLTAEKTDVKPGVGADTRYTYVKGCGANTFQLSAPIDSKITATLGMIGMTATTPLAAASRVSGPSTAYAPQGDALQDTQNDLYEVRLIDSGGNLIADVVDWTLNLNNNIKARKSQGVYGASGLNYGKFNSSVTMKAYYQDSDAVDAADANRDGMTWDMFTANHQYGLVVRLPNAKLRMPKLTYASNEPVMMDCEIKGKRHKTTNVQCSIGIFGYIPTEV